MNSTNKGNRAKKFNLLNVFIKNNNKIINYYNKKIIDIENSFTNVILTLNTNNNFNNKLRKNKAKNSINENEYKFILHNLTNILYKAYLGNSGQIM